MRQGMKPEAACKEALDRMVKRNPGKTKDIQVGFLAMKKKGEYGAYCLQKGYTFSVKSDSEEKVYTSKSIY